MPPAQRVDHLRKRLRSAEEELARRSRAVDATEAEVDALQARLKLEVESRDDFSSKIDDLRVELQDAEDKLPRPSGPKKVGRQLPLGHQGVVERLREVRDLLIRESGGALTTDVTADFDKYASAIVDLHQECSDAKAAKEAQVASDAKMAFRLQVAESCSHSGAKHARDDTHHDEQGDGLMGDGADQGDGEAERNDEWQKVGKKGKGRVPVCPPSKPQEPGTSSAASLLLGAGAAADSTVPSRGRTPERRPDRARSPRRPQATGTPATSGESGTLAQPVVEPTRVELGTPPGAPPPDPLSAAARGDVTPAVSSSLSSLVNSREASPAERGAQTADAVVAQPPSGAGTSN
jgi:hypothetical protein